MLPAKKILCTLSLLGMSAAASATTTTFAGQMDVQLTIVSTCSINGGTSGSADFGTLNFGDDLANLNSGATASTNLIGSGITMTCTPGLNYTIGLGSGSNLAAGSRNLISGNTKIPYSLVTSSGEPWGKGNNQSGLGSEQSFTANGSAVTLPIKGKIANQSTSYLAGVYKDKVDVTISW